MIRKTHLGFWPVLVSCYLLFSCADKEPTKPKPTEGVFSGQVTESNTLPIAGAQINIGYDLGQATAPPAHRVKMPSPDFAMEQNYPNPYNPVTNFQFRLGRGARVVLQILPKIYAGNFVATVLDANLQAGLHQIMWNTLLPDSTLLTNGNHLYRLQALDGGIVVFEDERYLLHNSLDPEMAVRMKPLVTTDVNGKFAISHAETSIGDTVAITLEVSPEIKGGNVIGDSITVFISRAGYKTATRRMLFPEKGAPVLNVVLERS